MMTERKAPRDIKVCFWCKWLDHSGPECRRRAPLPTLWQFFSAAEHYTDAAGIGQGGMLNAAWPVVDPVSDFCGEFEEGNSEVTWRREPKDSDTEFDCEPLISARPAPS